MNEVKGLLNLMSNAPKIVYCQHCGKAIGNVECYQSAKILRGRFPKGDPRVFDVWFMDYCNDCAGHINLDDISKEAAKQ